MLVYVTVVITVLSGAEYFFGLRRGLLERSAASAAPPAEPSSGGAQGS